MCFIFLGLSLHIEGLANETAGKIIVNGCVAWSGGRAAVGQSLHSSSAPQLLRSLSVALVEVGNGAIQELP